MSSSDELKILDLAAKFITGQPVEQYAEHRYHELLVDSISGEVDSISVTTPDGVVVIYYRQEDARRMASQMAKLRGNRELGRFGISPTVHSPKYYNGVWDHQYSHLALSLLQRAMLLDVLADV
jgi:hypothetical protein